jgi:lipid II:glycine glycyltransferase (peptidoglycan interpeptide bridge formation enzyme)
MKMPEYKVEVDSATNSEWSELVDKFADANIYQTWAYGATRWGRQNLSHLVLKREGEVAGIAQLRIVRPGNLRMGIAYLRWGPLCQPRGKPLDPEVVKALAAALREEYVRKKGLYVEILPNAFSGSSRAEAFQSAFSGYESNHGLSSETYRTLVLDLEPPLEELRKKLDKKWRNQLNAAERSNLTVIEGEGIKEYRSFCELYAQMRERKKFTTAVSIEEFGRIQESLPEKHRMRVLICEQEGKPLAGVVCSAIGESAIYLLGATNQDGMKSKGAYLLHWTLIRRLKEKGVGYYDLGGIDPEANPGVYHFKRGFSGVDVSHMDALTTCDNSMSLALVKAGQVLRDGWRRFRLRPGHAQSG